MSENAPPNQSGTSATANPASDISRGLPYYEKIRRDLRETIQKKRILDQTIATLEESIYRLETQYLEETSAGNIIKGFDNYVKGSSATSTSTGPGTATRRKGGITDADRIFSRSSASFMKDSPEPTSAQTTPSHAPTPNSSFAQSARESNHPTPTSATNRTIPKKNKKTVDKDDEDTDGKERKRGKISYGRD